MSPRCCLACLALGFFATTAAADPPDAELARQAKAVLQTHCHRCHGQDGAAEGGMAYVLDRERLVARGKVIPGDAAGSPLLKRIAAGKMPPPGEAPRPGTADIALLRHWIDAGAPATTAPPPRRLLADADLYAALLADLDRFDRRSRRFLRYFSLAPQSNAGLADDELQAYRVALAHLLNSLSWHPKVARPVAVDPAGVVLRIDLRDYLWDAALWDRLLAEYPYGVSDDSAAARACTIATLTRLPLVRADWFVATACRPPLYHDLLQLPSSATELERQLRIDAAADILQERVARLGFNGSGVSRNNRILERHVSPLGAYWRTYDFDAVPQTLLDRDLLLPDRRNVFAYPLGPGGRDNSFQHAGGEIIFSLPNGLQGFLIVNALGTRLDKAPGQIVSDPKRPDRLVEAGVSCMSCHVRGINPKDDQIRDHVARNPKAFSEADAELVRALYVPKEKMRGLMDEDAERYKKAVEKAGGRVEVSSPVAALTLRYEADVDLATAAAEVGRTPEKLLAELGQSEAMGRNLGALRVPGGTVPRTVWVQAFGDVARGLHLGTPLPPGQVGVRLPDNTGEIDPLEAQSGPANAAAISPDGLWVLFASADKSVRLWDVERGRERRRFVGHTASVWAVAFAPDGRRALSGGADGTVRLWDVQTGRELRRLDGRSGLVEAVAFSPDGRRALAGGYARPLLLWDVETGAVERGFGEFAQHVRAVALAPDGRRALVCQGTAVSLLDVQTGQELCRFVGHTGLVACAAFSPDGKQILSGGDDRTVCLWETASGRLVRRFEGHAGPVRCVAFRADGRSALSGGGDQTVRLWDVNTGQEVKRFARHQQGVVAAASRADGGVSVGRDGAVEQWNLR